MDFASIRSLCTEATETVVSIISAALKKVENPTPSKLAVELDEIRTFVKPDPLTDKEVDPVNVMKSGEEFIEDTIENVWCIKPESLLHHIKYLCYGCDGCAQFHYFEVIFSRPLRKYPIPQTTASVFVTVTISLVHGSGKVPQVRYRLEGEHQELDIRRVMLQEDWLFSLMRAKRYMYTLVEDMDVF